MKLSDWKKKLTIKLAVKTNLIPPLQIVYEVSERHYFFPTFPCLAGNTAGPLKTYFLYTKK